MRCRLDATSTKPQRSRHRLARLLWPLFRPRFAHFVGAFCLLVLSSTLMIVGPLLVKRAIDVDIANRDQAGLYLTVGLYLCNHLLYLICIYALRNWLEWVGQQMMADLRKKLFGHLLQLPLAFHDRNTPGQLLSRVESDTQSLRMLFTTTAVMLVGDVLLFCGMFIAMGIVSPRLTAVVSFLLPTLIGISVYFQRMVHPMFVEIRGQTAAISSRLTEFLQAMPVLKAFERRRWALARFQQINRNKFDKNFAAQRLVVLWFNLIFLMETVAFAAVMGIGGYWAVAGLVTVGTLAMFLSYVRRFFEPVLRLSEQLAMIQQAIASAERLLQLLDEPIAVVDPPDPVSWPGLKHELRFENVWFRYDEMGDWVLRDVSFVVPAGQRWALVGPTGSGKSTIISLLLRFYDPQRGRILVDGVDLRELKQSELRRKIGLVLQDIYLFPGPLKENLSLGRGFTDEQIIAAAQTTLANRFISRLPDGYDSDLSERGGNLSMGQRQLLSFTRALLQEPDLLILDEATSAVDPATEAMLTSATRRSMSGRTGIIVAHRLTTIRDCDQILVLQIGSVIQQGSHEELADAEGLYHALHQLQEQTQASSAESRRGDS